MDLHLRSPWITATLTDYVTRAPADTAIAHATRCARGLVALGEQGPLGQPDPVARPEVLVTSYTVSYGEDRGEMSGDGTVVPQHSMPARVVVQLAVPAEWNMEQVEAALRRLGERVRDAAALGEQAAPVASVMN